MISPPDHIARNPEANACWFRVQTQLMAKGEWRDEFQFSLEMLVLACADYLRVAREHKTRSDVTEAEERELEGLRVWARKYLADHFVIPEERVGLAVLDADGLDRDIAASCAR